MPCFQTAPEGWLSSETARVKYCGLAQVSCFSFPQWPYGHAVPPTQPVLNSSANERRRRRTTFCRVLTDYMCHIYPHYTHTSTSYAKAVLELNHLRRLWESFFPGSLRFERGLDLVDLFPQRLCICNLINVSGHLPEESLSEVLSELFYPFFRSLTFVTFPSSVTFPNCPGVFLGLLYTLKPVCKTTLLPWKSTQLFLWSSPVMLFCSMTFFFCNFSLC